MKQAIYDAVKALAIACLAVAVTFMSLIRRHWKIVSVALLIVAALVGYRWYTRLGRKVPAPFAHRIQAQHTGNAGASVEYNGDVVFLHGLAGEWDTTWQAGKAFWPEWIAEDIPSVRVWSISYNASPFGDAITFGERSKTLLETLRSAKIGREKPIIFVCHSLGGIMAIKSLNTAMTAGSRWESIGTNVKGYIFFGTPHAGSPIPGKFERALKILGTNSNVENLAYGESDLLDLGEWYRLQVTRLGIKNLVYYETSPTDPVGIIVDRVCANPGLSDVVMVPIEATHVGICKFTMRDDPNYESVKEFIEEILVRERRYDITLEDFLSKVAEISSQLEVPGKPAAPTNLTKQAQLRKHIGQEVDWTGVVIEIRDEKNPSYSLGLNIHAPRRQRILARFPANGSFDSAKNVGDTVRVVGKLNWVDGEATGAGLVDCRLVPLDRGTPANRITEERPVSSPARSD